MKDDIFEEALMLLSPNSHWSIKGEVKYENLTWLDEKEKPSEADVNAKIAELQAEYDSQEYARKRAVDYPSWQEQMDLIYHKGVAGLKAELKKTKDKFPKE